MALISESIQTDGIAQLSYLIGDDSEGVAAVFDPRADVDCYLQLAHEKQVSITHIFETHIHVDFVSGARELCARVGSAKIYLSQVGGARYGFDHEKIADGDNFVLGSALITARHTPGHTPEHLAYLLAEEDHPGIPWGVLTGDSLFVGSAGRPDLLGRRREKKPAEQLFHTLRNFYLKLDDGVIIYPAHGRGTPCGADIGDRHFAAERVRLRLQHPRKPASMEECRIPGRKGARERGEKMNSRTNTRSPGQLIPKRAAYLIGSLALLLICAAADAGTSVHARDYPGAAWSPYLVGAAIGVLSWLTFYFSDNPIGASSFYGQLAGFLGKLIAPRHTASLTYFKDKPPRVSWGFVFVVAAIVGGAIAALTGGEFANEWVPPIWEARFGDSVALRAAVAFPGGMLMAFGARLAGGCTSGHGISGTLQLNVASWIAVICFFVGGVAVALPLFKL